MTAVRPSLARRVGRRALEPVLTLSWNRLRAKSRQAEVSPGSDGSSVEHDVAAALISFDGYQRFWPALRHFTAANLDSSLARYWISETVPIADESEGTQVLVGQAPFIPRIRAGVSEVPSRYTFLIQEDIWFDKPVEPDDLARFVEVMDRHQLDCLKLGWSSYVPDDKPLIDASTDTLPGDPDFRWFGGNSYSMSHHASIFRTSFFLDACRLAEQVRITDGLRHEQFISTFFETRAKARNDDDRRVRIAVWSDEPVVSYAHAGWQGKLTPEGRQLLEDHDLLDLYDHSQDGADPPRPR